MKKVFLASMATVLITIAATAQKQESNAFHFGAGIKAAVPANNFDGYSFGLGAELQGEYMIIKQVAVLASAGYTRYFGKDGYDGINVIPVLGGARYYIIPSVFVGGKAGVVFNTAKNAGSAFNYLPQAGYNTDKFQASIGYDAWTKDGFTSGSVAASFIYKF